MNPADKLLEVTAAVQLFADTVFAGGIEYDRETMTSASIRTALKDDADVEWYLGLQARVGDVIASPESAKVFVTDEMVTLLESAMVTFPGDVTLTSTLPPWPSGLVTFARPVVLPMEDLENPENKRERKVDAFGWVAVATDLGYRYCVNAWQWSTKPGEQGFMYPTTSGLWHDGETAGKIWHDIVEPGADSFVRMVFTLWTLMVQRVAVHEPYRASRPFRRRWERAYPDLPVPDTAVVRLRRPTTKSHDAPEDAEHQGVNWSHRWMVDAHWHKYRTGTGRSNVEARWITPYVKGPEDKPLVVKQKVYTWER